MGRHTALALLLATACGDSNTTTASGGGTDTSGATDATGTTTGTSFTTTGGQTDSSDPTTSGGSNSATGATTGATMTATGTTTSTTGTTGTTTTSPDSDSGPDTTTGTTAVSTDSTTDETTTDGTTDGTTTMGVDTTTDTSGTTEPDSTTGGDPCGTVLKATIRDFMFAHPDFEDYGGNAAYTGLVEVDLGADDKPVYAHPGPTPQTTGPAEFAQWYNDTPGVNQTFMVDLPLTEIMPGLYQFADNTFFPIDGLGWGNEGQPNNFAFTTEIHTTFAYNGGEVFTFTGDDDVWVFINNKLAMDLGGLHPQLTDSVDLDQSAAFLGITPGQSYSMDIFHAERHTGESNFRIDTTIACFVPQ